jgi:hypothetical protein
MMFIRLLGWLITAAALMAIGAETLASLEANAYRSIALGELWYQLDRESLNLIQATTQRYLWPLLWDGITYILLQPAWLVLGITGPLLFIIFIKQKKKRRRR